MTILKWECPGKIAKNMFVGQYLIAGFENVRNVNIPFYLVKKLLKNPKQSQVECIPKLQN